MNKKKLVDKVLPRGRGNHSRGEERSRNGRLGRGRNAFDAKITADQETIDRNVEEIVARCKKIGRVNFGASIPIHVRIETVKGVRL